MWFWANGKALSWLNSMDLVSGRFGFRPWELRASEGIRRQGNVYHANEES